MKKSGVEERLRYYLSLDYPMVITKDEGVYFVQFPDLQGCMAHGKTHARAIRMAEEIKEDWIREMLNEGVPVPEPRRDDEFSGKFIVRIPQALHRRLSEQAHREGRSLNQHVGILLSERSNALSVDDVLKPVKTLLEGMGKRAPMHQLQWRTFSSAICLRPLAATQEKISSEPMDIPIGEGSTSSSQIKH